MMDELPTDERFWDRILQIYNDEATLSRPEVGKVTVEKKHSRILSVKYVELVENVEVVYNHIIDN